MTSYKSYAGFTIGPIYDVLSHSRRTRELWFGSYFFSWFMEKMVETLSAVPENEFLVPYVEMPFDPNRSITGKYHDRFILRSALDRDKLFNNLKAASDMTMDNFAGMINELVLSEAAYMQDLDKNNITEILADYIQRNFVVLDAAVVNNANPVRDVSKYLDTMEENRSFATGEVKNTCFICKTLPSIASAIIYFTENNTDRHKQQNLCPLCFIKYFCFRSKHVKARINDADFRYPPVLDISAGELLTEDVRRAAPVFKNQEKDYNFKDVESVIRDLYGNEAEEKIRPYHKYLAILQADGDNLGRVLSAFGMPDRVSHDFSKPLFDFAGEAGRLISGYAGQPVYIGGDDILAFVPVAFRVDGGDIRTVFDLSVDLAKRYSEIVDRGSGKTTLSIGINIAYYKFPLSKALANAREQLFVKAKTGNKNTLAMMFTKHSGHQVEFSFVFGTNEINLFGRLLKEVLAGDVKIPHSLHHNLARFKHLIAHIPDRERLHAFFENNFNEPVHSAYSGGLQIVEDYFGDVLFCYSGPERLRAVEEILRKLAFIKFLRGDA